MTRASRICYSMQDARHTDFDVEWFYIVRGAVTSIAAFAPTACNFPQVLTKGNLYFPTGGNPVNFEHAGDA